MNQRNSSNIKHRSLSDYEAFKSRVEPSDSEPSPGIPNAYRLFFRESLRSLRLTASVFPSSRKLACALARPIDFRQARTVVELGPGTGVVTNEILKRLRHDGRLFAIDMIPTFIDHLRATCHDPRLTLLCGSATELQSLLASHGVGPVDGVVSSLPLTRMDHATRMFIMHQIGGCLAPDGTFTQCQYAGHFEIAKLQVGGFNEERFLRGFFADVSIERVILNLPPTLVFACRKWRQPARSTKKDGNAADRRSRPRTHQAPAGV